MQTTHDVWPELQDQDLPKGKLKWGDGLRSEEEEYIVTLENKLANLKRKDRPVLQSPEQEQLAPFADIAESIASDPEEGDEEVLVDETNIVADEDEEPGLALLWDQPKEELIEGPPEQYQDHSLLRNRQPPTNPQYSRLSRAASTANKVQFSPRVRITSGVHINTPTRRLSNTSFVPSFSGPSSASSSVSVSLRTDSPRTWLYPSQVNGSSSSDVDGLDYFSVNLPSSSRTSSRRTSLPYNSEEERLAAEAARARAVFMYPAPSPTSTSLLPIVGARTALFGIRREPPRPKVIKTEDQVVWGSHTKWLNWRWWSWKLIRGWKGFLRWMYRADEDEWEESIAERRALI